MDWIKVKTRKPTPEEKEDYGNYGIVWDMQTPEDDDSLLLSNGSIVWVDYWLDNGVDSGFENTDPDNYKNLWYMPFPEPPTIEEVEQ